MSEKKSGQRLITPQGYARFQDELQRLWHQDRPRLVHEVSDAAALGDRSENAEYIYGKRRLREIDRRIKELSELLERLTVVDPAQNESKRIQFGATITVEDEDGKRTVYQLVGEDEVEAKEGRISMVSPVGAALVGKAVGDSVLVIRPKGELELTIVALKYR